MAEADLGVRVFLIDNLSSPMGLVTDSVFMLGSALVSGLSQAEAMAGQLSALETEANNLSNDFLAGNLSLQEYNDAMAANQVASAQLASDLTDLTGTLQLLGGTLGAGIMFFAFSDGLKTSVHDASDLQDTMAQLQISIQGASAVTPQLTTYLFQVASASIYSADEIAQGWNLLGEKGYTATQIMAGMGQQAINLAEAIGDPSSGTVGAANLLSTAMEVMRAKASDAGHYADLLTFAFYNGIPSVDGLRSALEQVGGRAQMLNVPFDQLVVALDSLGRAGMTGQQAGASLNYALQALFAPVQKTTHELEYLGLITVGQHVAPQLTALSAKFQAVGASMPKFDGTANGLEMIFKEGQKAGAIPLADTFYQWAVDNHLVSDAFYTSSGKAKDLISSLDILYQTLKNKTPEEQAAAFQQLFNVRSSQGVTQLMHSLAQLDAAYHKVTKSNDEQGIAAHDAAIRTATLNASWKELQTTFTDFMALAGTPLIQGLSNMLKGINTFIGGLTTAHPIVAKFFGLFLMAGTVAAGIALIVGMVMLLTAVTAALDVALAPIIFTMLIVMAVIIGVALVIAGIVLAIQHWGAISHWIGGVFSALGTQVHQIFSKMGKAIGDFFSHIGTEAHQKVTDFKNMVGNAFSGVGTKIHDGLEGAKNTVKGWGNWLYNHNYYVKAVVDAWPGYVKWAKEQIMLHLNQAKAFIGNVFESIGTQVRNDLTNIKNVVGTIFSWIGSRIHDALTFIQGIVGSVFGWIQSNITGHVQAAGNTVSSTFSSLAGRVGGALGGLWNTVSGFFGNLAGAAFQWGANIIRGIINGIGSMISSLGSSVHAVASTISGFLGFHSPTKEGPGSTADTWMPNLMRMFTIGIHGGIPALRSAASMAADALHGGFYSPGIGGAQRAYATANASINGGNTTVPINIDGHEVTTVVLNRLTGQLQMSGSGRLLR